MHKTKKRNNTFRDSKIPSIIKTADFDGDGQIELIIHTGYDSFFAGSGISKTFGIDITKFPKCSNNLYHASYILDLNGNGKSNILYNGVVYEYDNLGRVVKITEEIMDDSHIMETLYEYNDFGNLSKIIYPSGLEAVNQYNNKGYFSGTHIDQDLIAALHSTNSKGQPLILTYNNMLLGKVYEWDDYNNIEKITLGSQGIIQEFEYAFNPNTGNLTWRKDNINNLKESFVYDNLNRLTSFNIFDYNQGTNPLETVTMNYAAIGNIEEKSDIGLYNYGHATNPYALTDLEITNIDLVKEFPQNIIYTSYNKVREITEEIDVNNEIKVEFKYAANRQRIAMYEYINNVLDKTTYYAPLYEQTHTDGGNSVTHHNYINGPDGLAAVLIDNGQGTTRYYINKDHLGSITALIDENGNLVEAHNYDPWGRRRNPADWTSYTVTPFTYINRGYTGHEHLEQHGLINMNGRMYDPITARFLSADPFVPNSFSSQDYNRYTYVLNNPLKYTDPSGYSPFPLWRQIWGAITGDIIYHWKVPIGHGKTLDNDKTFDASTLVELIDFFASSLFLSTPELGGGGGDGGGYGPSGVFSGGVPRLSGGLPIGRGNDGLGKPRYKLDLVPRGTERFYLTKQGGYYPEQRVLNIMQKSQAGEFLSDRESKILQRVNIPAYSDQLQQGQVVDGTLDFDIPIPYFASEIEIATLVNMGTFDLSTIARFGNKEFNFINDPFMMYSVSGFDRVNIITTGTVLQPSIPSVFTPTVVFNLIITKPPTRR